MHTAGVDVDVTVLSGFTSPSVQYLVCVSLEKAHVVISLLPEQLTKELFVKEKPLDFSENSVMW